MLDFSLDELDRQLAGRTKRALIERMIVRTPHALASERLVDALSCYPLVLLLLAAAYPTHIWLLDNGEKVSSATILTNRMRFRRWHRQAINVDECDGLTDIGPGYLAIVVSSNSKEIMIHEFAHVVSTFLNPSVRDRLCNLFDRARQTERLLQPLAAESVGEFSACAFAAYFSPPAWTRLRVTDRTTYRLVADLFAEAERLSTALENPAAFARS
ncbi:MAG: hypothetical protein HYY04_02115 [Chloroflexi bacterium]|nr:hypothetical protein [Chloroflexota bacterium]